MNTTVNDQPPEREPEPDLTAVSAAYTGEIPLGAPEPIHYHPGTIEQRSPCGLDLDEVPARYQSQNPARVTCALCAATLVDGQLAEPERTAWRDMPLNELEDRLRGSLKAAAEFPELAPPPIGPVEAPAGHRTVSVEVLTPALLAEAGLTREDGTVGVVLRLDGALCSVDKTDEPWIQRPAPVKLIDLLRHAETLATSVIDPELAAELLMPGADVLAALAGDPWLAFTAPVESRWGLVKPGWYVLVDVDGEPDWAAVVDRDECHDPVCMVRGASPSWACAVTTVQGRGVQHLNAFEPVGVRIPAATAVER